MDTDTVWKEYWCGVIKMEKYLVLYIIISAIVLRDGAKRRELLEQYRKGDSG